MDLSMTKASWKYRESMSKRMAFKKIRSEQVLIASVENT